MRGQGLGVRGRAGGGDVVGRRGQLVIDIRALDPAAKRPIIFAIVATLLETGCSDDLLIVCEHEPAGLAYQLDLRRETRGLFTYSFTQRSDGAWVAMVQRKDAG